MIEEVRIESKKTKTFIFMDFAVYLLHLEGSLTPSSKGLILHITWTADLHQLYKCDL